MWAELTYALDGRVLGVELPTGGHSRNVRAQWKSQLLLKKLQLPATVRGWWFAVRWLIADS